MASQLLFTSVATTILIIISIFIMRHLRLSSKKLVQLDLPEPTKLGQILASALPNSVIFPHDVSTFSQGINSYWAKQDRNDGELSTAIGILKGKYNERAKESAEGHVEPLFAIRGGGHSPLSGAASIAGGGLSFFSPRYGLVCSNIISYQIVLASSILTTASESENPDL
ncbi:FAD binding domain-containing protein [Rutstroemia sp. NJR-2017a BBW]|nr:FAD binding domain-containing protein [Rutstroemia sp. NJR-2017a BBW]